MIDVGISRREAIKRYGVDPTTVGLRHRSFWVVGEIRDEEKSAGAQIGDLCVWARDGGYNTPDMSAGKHDNYVGTSCCDDDITHRYYYFREKEKC